MVYAGVDFVDALDVIRDVDVDVVVVFGAEELRRKAAIENVEVRFVSFLEIGFGAEKRLDSFFGRAFEVFGAFGAGVVDMLTLGEDEEEPEELGFEASRSDHLKEGEFEEGEEW